MGNMFIRFDKVTAPIPSSDDIRRLICDVVSGSEMLMLDENQTFDDSGIDSLDQAQILLAIQERYDVEIPEGEEDDYNTISKIMLLFS